MQFKYPEILYALFLLIIPIIIHLFRLQRFKKVAFTNVKFLKNIELQTRKSSRLKKWLILLTRLLIFASLIIAFSQPYFSNTEINKSQNTIIYLDNSLSLQAKGNNGELLKDISEKIIENSKLLNEKITLITNDNIYKDIEQDELKNILLNIKYCAINQDFEDLKFKIEQQIKTKNNYLNNIILITDFQLNTFSKINEFTNVKHPISLLKITPEKNTNIFIDSIFIKEKTASEITIKTIINNKNTALKNLPVSLYNNNILIGKSSVEIIKNTTSETEFTFPIQDIFLGKIQIEDSNLQFDNQFYFTISKSDKINALVIGKDTQYLSKIYTENEFNLSSSLIQNLDYNSINEQHLIVLNELNEIPTELITKLKSYLNEDGSIVVIPPINQLEVYKTLANQLNLGKVLKNHTTDLKITDINYNHPVLKNVFENRVTNFQYPTVKSYYEGNLKNVSTLLTFENEKPFIQQYSRNNQGNIYWFNAAISKTNSTFKNSPLIVPLFYNFAINSFKISNLYYTIGNENSISIATKLGKDDILTITNSTTSYIPLQQHSYNKSTITTTENPSISGFYDIKNNQESFATTAFNYNTKESDLDYVDLNNITQDNIKVASSIDEVFLNISKQNEINWLFKWFLAFAVLFLLIEILILKFFKV